MTRRIAITGGIGTGKSMVTAVLRVMGWPTYDCDSQALRLIGTDDALKREIAALLGDRAYDSSGRYDTAWVARRVFADETLLKRLNACVHPVVLCDIDRWLMTVDTPLAFIEAALLRQSGLQLHVDDIWRVVAPEPTRLQRVMRRSALTREQVEARILAQREQERPFTDERTLVNDNVTPLLPQIVALINECN